MAFQRGRRDLDWVRQRLEAWGEWLEEPIGLGYPTSTAESDKGKSAGFSGAGAAGAITARGTETRASRRKTPNYFGPHREEHEIDRIFRCMNRHAAMTMRARYQFGWQAERAAWWLQVSVRSYYRRLEKLEQFFAEHLDGTRGKK